MNFIAIVQARLSSSRFPGKVLKKIRNKTLLEILHNRLKQSKTLSKIIFSVPDNSENKKLHNFLKEKKYNFYRGSEKNVLDRYYKTAIKYNASYVARITSDCPIVDPHMIDKMFNIIKDAKADYISNGNPPTFPDGFDIEIFNIKSLKKAKIKSRTKHEKEHVTPYIIKSKDLKKINFKNKENLSNYNLTVNEPRDLINLNNIISHFKNLKFSSDQILKYIKKNDLIFKYTDSSREDGVLLGSGQKLWIRAKQIIPSGNMLLSKRAETILPRYWPSYFNKTKGCFVWDLDNKKYIDVGLMGVGTNVLGYNNVSVNNAVKKCIQKGNMSSLNCPEEVLLAERLIDLHPWADMVKFARTGGEANAIAVRIARACSRNDKIAICGYHGWHDWYLAANIQNKKNLNEHLLKGLNTIGVPNSLKNTVFPFKYNDYKELEKIVYRENVGIIKMEVRRNEEPKNDFLNKVRTLATKKNIILIFDECTSGFRETFGGLHKFYKVNPDMAIFGKALGNGYAITAVIGKREIMEVAEKSFISSTFWTERVGPTAALKTIEVMEKTQSWKKIKSIGNFIKRGWSNLSKKHKIKIAFQGLDSLPTFRLITKNSFESYNILITKKMLEKGFLFKNTVYASIAHNNNILKQYFKNLDSVFKMINHIENNFENNILKNPKEKINTFDRLN